MNTSNSSFKNPFKRKFSHFRPRTHPLGEVSSSAGIRPDSETLGRAVDIVPTGDGRGKPSGQRR